MNRYEEVQTADQADEFVSLLGIREEELILTALLKSLTLINAREAADKAGYDLEEQ